jgi:hypothetical protein
MEENETDIVSVIGRCMDRNNQILGILQQNSNQDVQELATITQSTQNTLSKCLKDYGSVVSTNTSIIHQVRH